MKNRFVPVVPRRSGTRSGWRHALSAWGVCLGLLGLGALPANAQNAPYDQVEQWINAGEWTLALNEAQRWLAEHPRDPQMRFMRGVILTQQGLTDEARQAFVALTREFPELPEPHNNLAVIEAAAGRLAQARESLLMAIRLNPAYATAHRNLGDVYLQLAAQSYRESLLQGGGTSAAVAHLQQVERLLTSPSR